MAPKAEKMFAGYTPHGSFCQEVTTPSKLPKAL